MVTEVIKQLGWSATVARPYHYRTADGVEVDRFVAGLVLNTGSQAQRVGDRLSVAPVDQLWHAEQS